MFHLDALYGNENCFSDRLLGSHYGAVQGTVILACSLGGALGPWLGGFLHDITGSYQSTLIVVQLFLVTSAVLMWVLKPGRATTNPH